MAPKYPDFSFELNATLGFGTDQNVWVLETDAGRPGTPVFRMLHTCSKHLPERAARAFAQEALEAAKDRCPVVGKKANNG